MGHGWAIRSGNTTEQIGHGQSCSLNRPRVNFIANDYYVAPDRSRDSLLSSQASYNGNMTKTGNTSRRRVLKACLTPSRSASSTRRYEDMGGALLEAAGHVFE